MPTATVALTRPQRKRPVARANSRWHRSASTQSPRNTHAAPSRIGPPMSTASTTQVRLRVETSAASPSLMRPARLAIAGTARPSAIPAAAKSDSATVAGLANAYDGSKRRWSVVTWRSPPPPPPPPPPRPRLRPGPRPQPGRADGQPPRRRRHAAHRDRPQRPRGNAPRRSPARRRRHHPARRRRDRHPMLLGHRPGVALRRARHPHRRPHVRDEERPRRRRPAPPRRAAHRVPQPDQRRHVAHPVGHLVHDRAHRRGLSPQDRHHPVEHVAHQTKRHQERRRKKKPPHRPGVPRVRRPEQAGPGR